MKILVVDDDVLNRKVLIEMIEDACGIDSIEAEDGKQAIDQLIQNDDIVCILLDKMMPNMDGFEFMEEKVKDDHWSKIPVIMQTAAAGEKDVIEGAKTDVYYYLTKPFEQRMLTSVLHSALEKSKEVGLLPADFKF